MGLDDYGLKTWKQELVPKVTKPSTLPRLAKLLDQIHLTHPNYDLSNDLFFDKKQ